MKIRRAFTSSRVVLCAGFGGLLAIIGRMAWKGAQVVDRIHGETTRLRLAYAERADLLDALRFTLSESASDVRDYLLARDPAGARDRRAELLKLRRGARTRSPGMAAKCPLMNVRRSTNSRDIDAYWHPMEPVLSWDAATRGSRGDDFLRQELIPRHRQLLALTDNIDRVHARNLVRSNRNISELFTKIPR